MTKKLSFTTTGCWDDAQGFGCASLGLAGICGNDRNYVLTLPWELEAVEFSGTYQQILEQVDAMPHKEQVQAAILVFGNAGGENEFLVKLQQRITCPVVGGGAAIDFATSRKGLIPGGKEAALLLITDERYTYRTETKCVHDQILETCTLTLEDPRTAKTINGEDAVVFYNRKRQELGLGEGDFEHLTLSDKDHVNAHLSISDGKLRSGRDLHQTMLLRYVAHEKVYPTIREFYDDPNALICGCAGLSGILDKPLDTTSAGLFLFGEVCMAGGRGEFGNLMLSKLQILPK